MAGVQVHSRVNSRVALVAARAGVERPNQHEVGGEGQRPFGPRNGDNFVFERLPQHLQRLLGKLGQFV